MAIKTSTFGGWELSDEHAEAFLRQHNDLIPNPLATAAVLRGRKYAEEYFKNGSVTFILANKDKSKIEE